jgi:NADH dehydrogenase
LTPVCDNMPGNDDALYLRNELIKTVEKAAIETDPIKRKKLLAVVIAGGGPTGVEVAGMLVEMKKYILGKDYPQLKQSPADIHLIDGSPYLLAPMSDKSHAAAYKALHDLGVQIKLNIQVILYENEQVHLSDGNIIEAASLVWAAGVIANSLEGIPEESMSKGRRIFTDSFNRVKGYNNIYAIGDISIQFGDPSYPMDTLNLPSERSNRESIYLKIWYVLRKAVK